MKYISLLILSFTLSLAAHAEDVKYKPDNMQSYNNYIDIILDNEKGAFLSGGNNLLVRDIPNINSSEAIADYKANELKANKKYKGKQIRIKTIATAIKEGIANKPYITANGKNSFENIIIYINPDDDRYLDISKGDKVDLICEGDGVLMGSPIFDNCQFSKDYIEAKITTTTKEAQLLTDDSTIKTTKATKVLHAIYIINEKEIEKACIDNNVKKCITATETAVKKLKESALKKYNVK